jgi:homeobox-leucine zipper protein
MMENCCAGVSASSARKWVKLDGMAGSIIGEDVRVMGRKSVNDTGEPSGVVLSAATSVWLPVAPEKLFNFLRDGQLRAEWDILSNGNPMQEIANITKGQGPGNSVSLLRVTVSIIAYTVYSSVPSL